MKITGNSSISDKMKHEFNILNVKVCQKLLFRFFNVFDQLSFVRWLKPILVFLYARFISGNLIMISLFLFFSFDKDEFNDINLFRCSLNRRKALPLVISIAFAKKIRDPFKLVTCDDLPWSALRSWGERLHFLWALLAAMNIRENSSIKDKMIYKLNIPNKKICQI